MSAPRPTWKGTLQISLVHVPIKVFPATDTAETISFNQLHAECQSRIHQKRWCDKCEREVPMSEIVSGFEFTAGKYVVLTDEEREAAKPPSARVVNLTRFGKVAALDPTFVDRTYYLAPDGPRAGEAFAVLREGMRGQVGIGTLAIYGREYLVAVRAAGGTLLLHTLHHAGEIREPVVEDVGKVVVTASQVRLAKQVIALFAGPLALDGFVDSQQAELRRVIDLKIAGQQIIAPVVESAPVTDLKEALEASLRAAVKKPAKVLRKRAS